MVRLDTAQRKTATPAAHLGKIYFARSTPAKYVGRVEAADPDAAIEAATKEFEVKDPRRLIAVKRA